MSSCRDVFFTSFSLQRGESESCRLQMLRCIAEPNEKPNTKFTPLASASSSESDAQDLSSLGGSPSVDLGDFCHVRKMCLTRVDSSEAVDFVCSGDLFTTNAADSVLFED